MPQTHNMRVSPQYINVSQYLLDTQYPLDRLFKRPEERHSFFVHKLGYHVNLAGGGFCKIRRIELHWQDLQSQFSREAPRPVTYSTEETLQFWDDGVRSQGWESLLGGELFTIKKDDTRFGFIHSDQIGIYLGLRGIISRVIPLEDNKTLPGVVRVLTSKEFSETMGDYVGLCLLETKVRPRNPCFTKRKRQIIKI